MTPRELIRLAIEARTNAYAPYSGFYVGAALLSADGRVFTGCNVENASSPAGCCAERTALFKAVSEGARDFLAIAVVGAPCAEQPPFSVYAAPCGVCRQALHEFGGNLIVYTAKSEEDYREQLLSDLLPDAFSR